MKRLDLHGWGWIAAIVVGALLRFVLIEHRPIHHDESVNWFLVGGVMRKGLYVYDATNYHGPTFFYLSVLGRALAPEALWGLRWPTALVGALTVPLCWLFRQPLGRNVALVLAWVVALSPTHVFYSRQAIHETLLAAATVFSAAMLMRLVTREGTADRRRSAIWLGVGAGLMWATKETAALTFVGWACAALTVRRADGIRLPDLRESAIVVAIALAVSTVFFAGFGFDPGGALRPFVALATWGERGIDGGGQVQPWYAFGHLLVRVEAPLIVLAACASHRTSPWVRAAAVWFVVVLGLYSLLPYKTPWCAVQIVLPLALLAAFGVERLLEMHRPVALYVGRGAVGAAAILALGLSVETSFFHFDVQRLPLVHVQTHRQLHHAMLEVRAIMDAVPDVEMRIYHPTKHPINWYLRRTRHRHEVAEPWPDAVDGHVLLASPRQRSDLEERIGRSYQRRTLRFRDGLRLDLWLDDTAFDGLAQPCSDDHEWKRVRPVGAFDPPPRPSDLEPGWSVRWIEGRDFEAAPFLVERRHDVDVWFSNDYEKPRMAPLSMVWEAWIEIAEAGRHGFATRSDDGSRLWIDGRMVVANWGEHGVRLAEGQADLQAGWHHVRIDWFDMGGPARLEALWTPPGSDDVQPWPDDLTWSMSPTD